jgi:hypothetical protein
MLSAVVFLESAWELAEHLLGRSIWFHSAWILLPLALTALPLTQLCIELRKKNRELKQAADELDSPQDEGGCA